MLNYSFKFTPAESNAGGTLLYVVNHISYKPWTDLSVNKTNQLEFTYIEVNSRKNNIIVGCPYKHSNMDMSDFNKKLS